MTHKLIHTSNYLLVVDDSGTRIAHLPLNGSPILEGVNLLPPLEDEVEKLAEKEYREYPNNPTDKPEWTYNKDVNCHRKRKAYIKGFNAHKELVKDKLFTVEDMEKAVIFGFEYQHKSLYNLDVKEFIQSLSQSKMPIGFECEENTFFATNAFSSDITLTLEGLQDTVLKGIKTTTNSQGHTQWVGKYIY